MMRRDCACAVLCRAVRLRAFFKETLFQEGGAGSHWPSPNPLSRNPETPFLKPFEVSDVIRCGKVLLVGHARHLEGCKGPPEPPTEEEVAAQVGC